MRKRWSWEDTFDMAYGPLNLHPDQFWDLIPYEYNLLIKGYYYRVDREMDRTAWVTANMINGMPAFGKKTAITAKQLLGREIGGSSLEQFQNETSNAGSNTTQTQLPMQQERSEKAAQQNLKYIENMFNEIDERIDEKVKEKGKKERTVRDATWLAPSE